MRNKTVFTIVAVLIFAHSSFAQYFLKFTVKNPKDSIIYFRGVAFDNKNFIPKDTLDVSKGTCITKASKPIVGGIYFLYFPSTKERVFFTMQNKDSMSFTLSGNDPLGTIHCSKKENNIYFDYQLQEKGWNIIDSLYQTELARGRKFSVAQKDGFFKEKRDTLMAVRQRIEPGLNKQGILAMHFKTMDALDNYLPQRSRPDLRAAFIEQFDLNTPRLLFTPHIHDILNEYLSAFPLISDSLQTGIKNVMKTINCTSKAREYILDYFITIMNNRNIQNNTKGIIDLIDEQIIQSKCKLNNEKKEINYMTLYQKTKELNAHDTALNMELPDTAKTNISLFMFAKEFDYTVIMFYAPTCEHCKIELPLMDSTISDMEKRYNVKIGRYAVCNESGVSDIVWKNFIYSNHLTTKFVHVMMSTDQKIRTFYDAYSTPQFFLIDKNHKLVAKKISAVSLRRMGKALMIQLR